MLDSTARKKRWGIVLAGGDGSRLQSLSRVITGDDRPKQFCRILGQYTLLEQTRYRVAISIPSEQTIFALTRAHEHYYLQDLGEVPSQKLIQPSNSGTAPPTATACTPRCISPARPSTDNVGGSSKGLPPEKRGDQRRRRKYGNPQDRFPHHLRHDGYDEISESRLTNPLGIRILRATSLRCCMRRQRNLSCLGTFRTNFQASLFGDNSNALTIHFVAHERSKEKGDE